MFYLRLSENDKSLETEYSKIGYEKLQNKSDIKIFETIPPKLPEAIGKIQKLYIKADGNLEWKYENSPQSQKIAELENQITLMKKALDDVLLGGAL